MRIYDVILKQIYIHIFLQTSRPLATMSSVFYMRVTINPEFMVFASNHSLFAYAIKFQMQNT